jgi:hypothetical protein
MTKRNRTLLIILLLAGGLVFLFRYGLIDAIQQRQISRAADKAFVDNSRLVYPAKYSRHRVYALRGMDRLWVHRVNSLRRFRYLYNDFPGFECDIQLVPGGLALGHDAAGPDLFSDFLRADSGGRKLFWMDIKNAEPGNIGTFCKTLQLLDRQYGIRDRVIIECYDTVTAKSVDSLGFLTALNIDWIRKAPRERTLALPRLCPETIDLLSAEYPLGAPLIGQLPGTKQICWDIRFVDGMDQGRLLHLANDTSMLVCLINVKSPGYR